MKGVALVAGELFTDERGSLSFFNSLSLSTVQRMYQIAPANTAIIRAWQAHKVENKWFYCTHGSFLINLMEIDDFRNPSKTLKPKKVYLQANTPAVLHVQGGYASGIKAVTPEAKLLVFSDQSLAASSEDDYRYPLAYWPNVNWNID